MQLTVRGLGNLKGLISTFMAKQQKCTVDVKQSKTSEI